MIDEIKYEKHGKLSVLNRSNSIGVFSTRNYSDYSLQVVRNLILKFKEKFVFYFTYDFYLRCGLYKLGNITYEKVLIIEKEYLHHSIVQKSEAQLVIEPYSSNKRVNYLVKDLVILNFVKKVLILEATKFSSNLKILSEIASEKSIDVFCLPGRITDPSSYGTNRIIYDGAVPLFDFELLNS